jgi:putative methyltransferase
MRILFYYCCHEYANKEIFIGTAHLYLKTFVDINYPDISSKLEWLEPLQHRLTIDELYYEVQKLKPDIICSSHYVWNHSFLLDQLPKLKTLVDKNIKFVVGGPNINCHIDKDFFKKYHFADYAVYGPGEKAFSDILKNILSGTKLRTLTNSNLAWKDKDGEQIVAPYQFQPELNVSPYVHNKDILEKLVNLELKRGYKPALAYSQTRGCPYSCTFCDWNSGLSNKVSRRKTNFQQDIDLFHDIGLKEFFLADANVGQYDDDIEMIKYFAIKNKKYNANFHIRGNYSKLKKQNNLIIYKILAEHNLILTSFNFSVQDVNINVLKNIQRPDVGWDTHRSMIEELVNEFSHMHATVQLIQGLPGQNFQSWKQTLITVSKEKTLPMIFVNETLPASPAMLDKEYQQKWNFEYINSLRFNGKNFYRGEFAASCDSFSKDEFVKMSLISIFCTALSLLNLWLVKNKQKRISLETLVDSFMLLDTVNKLHSNLTDNWKNKNNFFFTLNFDCCEDCVSACSPITAALNWLGSKNFIKFIINNIPNESNTKLQIIKIIKQEIRSKYTENILLEHS